jgi:hypothetical protein
MTSPNLKTAFTLRDLLIVLAILPLIIFGLMTNTCRSRETANRVKCASNLRQIGQAMLLYQNDNKGGLPRTVGSNDAPPCWGTGASAPDPFGPNGPAPNDITAGIFLLLGTQDITPEIFVCPSANEEKWEYNGKSAKDWSNWPKEILHKHLSYSFQNEYSDVRLPRTIVLHPPGPSSDLAIAADMNPGVSKSSINLLTVTSTSSAKDTRRANSPNHDTDGQNVLYEDGHVDFQQNPFVGVNRDNIYVRRAASTGFAPAPLPLAQAPYDANDSVLLPHVE